ncbi:uncharacterized protein LOC135844280 [Planococcus citri]|uniref:uncharacterized protein LOC135844280 n=1 Tax=Planococcus citri TaxID=170843 RepID=UPI0031F77079
MENNKVEEHSVCLGTPVLVEKSFSVEYFIDQKFKMPARFSDDVIELSGVLELHSNSLQCKFIILKAVKDGLRLDLNHEPFANVNSFVRNYYRFTFRGKWYTMIFGEEFAAIVNESAETSKSIWYGNHDLHYDMNTENELVESDATVPAVAKLLQKVTNDFIVGTLLH